MRSCLSGLKPMDFPYLKYACSRESNFFDTPLNGTIVPLIVPNCGYTSNSSFPNSKEHLYRFFIKFLLIGIASGSKTSPCFGTLYDFRIISFLCNSTRTSLNGTSTRLRVTRSLCNNSSSWSSWNRRSTLSTRSSFGVSPYLSKIEISSSNVSVKFFNQFKSKCLQTLHLEL